MYCHFQARLQMYPVRGTWSGQFTEGPSYAGTCTLAKICAISFHSRNSTQRGPLRGRDLPNEIFRLNSPEGTESFPPSPSLSLSSLSLLPRCTSAFLYPFLCNRWHLIESFLLANVSSFQPSEFSSTREYAGERYSVMCFAFILTWRIFRSEL